MGVFMLNTVALQGRLTRDVELRRTQSGTAVASFSLAVEQDYAGSDGKRGVDFINCVAWKGTAEFVEKYFHKGDMMIATGRISVRGYEDKDGKKRTATEVVMNGVNFCGSKSNSTAAVEQQDFKPLDEDDGDLPF